MSNRTIRIITASTMCAAALLGLGATTASAAPPPPPASSISSPMHQPGDSTDVRVILADVEARLADRAALEAELKSQFGDDIPADYQLTGVNLYRIEATSPSWGHVSPDRYTNFAAVVGLAWDSADGSQFTSNVMRINYVRTHFEGFQLTPDQVWGGDQPLVGQPRLSLADALAAFERFRADQGHTQLVVDYAALRTPSAGGSALVWMFMCGKTPYFVNAQTGEVTVDSDSVSNA